jgi:predicted transposase/invertase (TIGR01784 family)
VFSYEFRSEEIKQTAFRVDGLLVPPVQKPDAPLVFVEVQFQPDLEFYGRFFAEIFLYLYRAKPVHPWRALVIYPDRARERGVTRHYSVLLRSAQVTRIYLDDWRNKPADTLGLALVQLIISTPEQAPTQARTLAQRAVQDASHGLALPQVIDLIETILVYKLPQLSREEIRVMLGLHDTDLKETRFYQEVFAEGRQEGRQEGRIQESRRLVLKLWSRRFGPPDARWEAAIQRLSLEQIEALVEALLDFKDAGAAHGWLRNQGVPIEE